jgi:hypothetical protein
VRPPPRQSVIFVFVLGVGVEEIVGATETAKPDTTLVHGVVFAKMLAADLASTEHHFFIRSLTVDTVSC